MGARRLIKYTTLPLHSKYRFPSRSYASVLLEQHNTHYQLCHDVLSLKKQSQQGTINKKSDVVRDTENEDQHVDSTNTHVVLPQPPNCNPKATEFEVKIR
ncbi:hypothetical protein Hanom_Chr05g00386711 [Helianthus anomalus]